MSTNRINTEDRLDLFILISSVLTGYEQTVLWGTGMAEQYLAKVDKELGVNMTDKLLAYGNDAANLLDDDTLRAEARAVMKLWYLAQWCVGLPPPLYAVFSVSPTAYTESLAWRAMGGHPQGARQQGFASWSNPPIGAEEKTS